MPRCSLNKQLEDGNETHVRSYAAKYLPDIQTHTQMIHNVASNLGIPGSCSENGCTVVRKAGVFVSAQIDRDIAEADDSDKDEVGTGVTGPDDPDLTSGQTPAQDRADDETSAPEQDGGEDPVRTGSPR
jgi:hypothetical protein